jgi:hypothetical protein
MPQGPKWAVHQAVTKELSAVDRKELKRALDAIQ